VLVVVVVVVVVLVVVVVVVVVVGLIKAAMSGNVNFGSTINHIAVTATTNITNKTSISNIPVRR
jgi:hypothetical protein